MRYFLIYKNAASLKVACSRCFVWRIFSLSQKRHTYKYKKISSIDIYTSMPSVVQVAQNLENRYISGAPKANEEKIKRVIQIYKENKNVTRNIAEKVVMSL